MTDSGQTKKWEELQQCISVEADLQKKAVLILRKLKDSGVTAEEVKNFLNEMRKSKKTKQNDDYILDLLDIVSGFCSKHLRVW